MQHILPPEEALRFEGVAFTASGAVLAAVAADTSAVLLFRRGSDGRFDHKPYCTIGGPRSGLKYPHAATFSQAGDGLLLAVVQRDSGVAIFQRNADGQTYVPAPVWDISGLSAQLEHPDGVAFVPPDDAFIAVCNLTQGSITFYERLSLSPVCYFNEPVFVLRHASLEHPDGLAFSADGTWLATANHWNHTVSIFRRRKRSWFRRSVAFGPEPVSVIDDKALRHPHSVAFSPLSNHVAVTSAGANFFSVYAPSGGAGAGAGWSRDPVLRQVVGAEEAFRRVNTENPMEGGAKGIAIAQQSLAICSPQIGIKIYPIRERVA